MNSLKEHRSQQGLSVRQLAEKSGVNPSAISLIENDRRRAQQLTLSKLAAALDVPPDTFSTLLDTAAAERGRLSQRKQSERKRQQSQTLATAAATSTSAGTRPIQPARSWKKDYWVFDNEGTPYGPFTEDTARRLHGKLADAYLCQAASLTAAGEQYRHDLFAWNQGQQPAGFK